MCPWLTFYYCEDWDTISEIGKQPRQCFSLWYHPQLALENCVCLVWSMHEVRTFSDANKTCKACRNDRALWHRLLWQYTNMVWRKEHILLASCMADRQSILKYSSTFLWTIVLLSTCSWCPSLLLTRIQVKERELVDLTMLTNCNIICLPNTTAVTVKHFKHVANKHTLQLFHI